MLANRVRKMERHTGKWARRNGVSCYRIYDADIPEFPLAIDRYEGFLHVAEYQRRHPLSEEEYQAWRSGCREALCETLDIQAAHVSSNSGPRKRAISSTKNSARKNSKPSCTRAASNSGST